MKYEIIMWILIVILILTVIFLYLETDNPVSKIIINKEKGKKMQNTCKFLILTLYIITQASSNESYQLFNDKEEFAKYNTPQVDSTMYLSCIDKNRKIYSSHTRDSIYHSIKRVDYDWVVIDKITDEFYNTKNNQRLVMTFIKASLFRKEQRINQIIISKGCDDVVIDILNESRKDSVLKAWGFDDKLYKQDNRF